MPLSLPAWRLPLNLLLLSSIELSTSALQFQPNKHTPHYITHPLFLSNPVLLHQRLVFYSRKDSRLKNAINYVSISVQLQIGGFDSMSLTHSLTLVLLRKLYVGFRERKKQANKLDRS